MGGDDPPCMDAADADGNNSVFALLDALFLLEWMFSDGDDPPAPGTTDCGPDDDQDPDVDCLDQDAICTPPPP